MLRLLFSKSGNAVWISHLDTMRLFQRAFKRSGLLLTHTQGFNPRPSVSIALPLSVGVESRCELLDFQLDNQDVPCEQIKERLNCSLVEGITVLEVYNDGRKLKDLALLQCALTLEYDQGVPCQAADVIRQLFMADELLVDKKGKNGITQQDLIPLIKNLQVKQSNPNALLLEATVCCQNPSLNPNQIAQAILKYLPHLYPDFVICKRIELLTDDGSIFR